MNFKENEPIFLQVADAIADDIVSGKYVEDGRIHVIKMGNVGVLMVRPNKRVIEKDNSIFIKFFITPDRPIMEIESSVSNVDFELRCLNS